MTNGPPTGTVPPYTGRLVDIGILGPLEVRHEGAPLALGKPKQRALLAVLLLRAGRTVSVERLAGDLWEVPPRDLTGSLQAHVSRLRSVLSAAGGSALVVTEPPGYRIDLAGHRLDAERFDTLARAGRDALAAGRPEEALDRIEQALRLWRGDPLSDLWLGASARAEVARLEAAGVAAREDLVDALLALGRHRDALDLVDGLVAVHPLRERLWGQRITALYRSGRQAEALRAYGDVRRLLAEELGIAPGPELQALEAAVLEQRPEIGGRPAPAPPAGPPVPGAPAPSATRPEPPRGNLPFALTTFVGRAELRAEVAQLLGRHRLVTLVGFGGAGKTRLACEVAVDVRASVPGGAWLVDLSAAVDGSAVALAVAGVLGVGDDPFRPLLDRLADSLQSQELLVVLDNCEHLVSACAEVVGPLLSRCPGVRILATSREPLGIPGEVHVSVGPLTLPDEGAPVDAAARAEAVQLFIDRASLVRRDFALTAANAPAVGSVCRRLDGIPLAIELAAARLAVLSPQQIDQRLGDHFRVLADETSGRPARHRTLEATIAWSEALLDAAERVLLRRLSVFSGGFSLDAAEAVCPGGLLERPALLDHLARLVAKSLVVADTSGEEARYRILATIRQHAAERLDAAGEAPGVKASHARWFLDLAERAERDLGGPLQETWLGRLAVEHDNLRAALAWAVDAGDGDVAQRLAGALVLFWRVRGHVREGREWLEAALAVPGDAATSVRAKALWGAGFMATMAADAGRAIPALEESTRRWQEIGDDRWVARSLLVLGNARRFTDGALVALLLLDEAVSLARHADDAWCLGHALSLAGSVHLEQGHLDHAEALLVEAIDLAALGRDAQSRRLALWGLGQLRRTQGSLVAAGELFAEGLRLSRRMREPQSITSFAVALAEVHRARGALDLAAELLDEAEAGAPSAGPVAQIEVSCGAAALALARGDPSEAAARFAAALAVAHEAGSSSIEALLGLAEAAQALGDAAAAARHAGGAMQLSDAVGNRRGQAGALEVLGRLATADGRSGDAWAALGRSLQLRRDAGDVVGMIRGVGALGALAAQSALAPEGAALLAAAHRAREEIGLAATAAGCSTEEVAEPAADLPASARPVGSGQALDAAVDLALRLADGRRRGS